MFCVRCQRRFKTNEDFTRHVLASSKHNICDLCSPSVDCASIKALENHRANSHGLDQPANFHNPMTSGNQGRRPERTSTISLMPVLKDVDNNQGYVGIPSNLVKSVFRVACRLRSRELTAETVIAVSKSQLHPDIIRAITKAALRLLPVDNSPEGRRKRLESERLSAARAAEAEDAFTKRVASLKTKFYTELEQRHVIARAANSEKDTAHPPTPDLLLTAPVSICGHVCYWIEFKNDFGFCKSPFVTPRSKKQFVKYSSGIGPGLVVYRLGFEQNFLSIPGVKFLREAEALDDIEKHR